MKKQQELDEKFEWIKNPLLLGGIIFGIWIISGILIFQFLDSWSNRGTFGDMFGAVNSLFSGLALAGIIYTIFLQRNELELQRTELELNRKELARSAKAQEESEKEFRRQADNLKATARLNAMNTLIGHYKEREITYMSYPSITNDAKDKYTNYIKEIEKILEEKS